ncbi:glycosyltransferase [Alphaproteobacteria bacterium]|nr:glycosyltransferase [Alphaproteobacteria bacterium]
MNSSIVFVASSPFSVVNFLLPHIGVLKTLAPVRVLANTTESALLKQRGLDVEIDFVPIVRAISPWYDFKAFWILFLQFTRNQPMAVHTITPKAGLLGMSAAWLARVPIRTHSFTGQVWANKVGFKRWLLKFCDKLISMFATDRLIDSPSQRDFLIKEGVVDTLKSDVLCSGSICGVDTQRFCPNSEARVALRAKMGVDQKAFVCLYLGRLNRDKGILDLASAFSKFALNKPNVELWLVGPDEQGIYGEILNLMGSLSSQLLRVDYTSEPERFMQSADLFCLPSHREGFGLSIIEAAACRVPSLVSRIYGLTDAVIEGRTGWVHEAGNVNDITNNLETILMAPDEIKNRGKAARKFVENTFEQSLITGAMKRFYGTRLGV